MRTETLSIKGMSCGAGVGHVTRALTRQSGGEL